MGSPTKTVTAAMPAVDRRAAAPMGLPTLASLAAIAAFVVLAALHSHFTPLGDAPDEKSHLAYVQLIANHLRLPFNVPEDQQPPLYYLIAAVLYRVTGSPAAAQWLSITFGALTLATIRAAGRLLYPARPWRAVLPVVLAAAIPELQFISGSVTDDTLSFLSGAVSIALAIAVLHRPPSTRLMAAIGTAVALALLAKETDYVLAVVLLVTAALAWRRQAIRRDALLVAAVPLVAAGWWFVRNLVAYQRLLPGLAPYGGRRLKLEHLSQLHDWYDAAVRSSLAYFGNMTTSITLAGSQDTLYRLFELVVGVLLAIGLFETARRWRTWPRMTRATVAMLGASMALVTAQMVLNSVFVDYQAQGRYLYVGLAPAVLGAAFAVRAALGRLPRTLTAIGYIAVVAALAAVDVLGVMTVQAGLLG